VPLPLIRIVFALPISLVFGYWLGEHRQSLSFTVELILITVLFISALWQFKLYRFLSLMMLAFCWMVAFSVSWYWGAKNFQFAYNDGIQNGEDIRLKLADFYQQNQYYPTTLDQLNAADLPCQLTFPPQLLVYEATTKGYKLSFGDALITHTATEASPFAAHK
jgi:hypothetical protein